MPARRLQPAHERASGLSRTAWERSAPGRHGDFPRDIDRRRLTAALLLSVTAWHTQAGTLERTREEPRSKPSGSLNQRTLRVGPNSPIHRIADAAKLARDGDIVEIEPGDYIGDVAVWPQKRLTIRRAGDPRDPGQSRGPLDPPGVRDSRDPRDSGDPRYRGDLRPVRLLANGQAAEEKAIWVIRNGTVDIEGIEFHGTRVPDRNGAGIRFEGGHLTVRNCRFLDNETGILTGNDGVSELTLESCEFEGRAQPADGLSHNLYVGRIARFDMRACWSHHANTGHLVKTRARESRLFYNRLTDEPGGRASYEIDCPNGGVLIAVGNLVVQEPTTQNNAILSYGAEGYPWPVNRLVLAYNTFVNRREIGTFVRAYPGKVESVLANNLFVGAGITEGVGELDGGGNHFVSPGQFRDPVRFDYRLTADSALTGRAVAPPEMRALETVPLAQYEHPLRMRPLRRAGTHSPGASQD